MSGGAGDAGAGASSRAAATVSDRVAGAAGARGSRIRWLSHDSLSFDVIDDGPAGGPTALLLHGFPERASHWDAVSRVLHQHGVRTLALDQRGYSPGARPCGRWHYRMSCLVGDVLALIERYGAPVHVVGHDWGAAVAWATAEARPDLVQTLTTASVPHPAAFTRSLLTSSQAMRSWYVLAFQPPALPELLTRSAPAVVRGMLRSSGLTQDEVSRVWVEMIDDGALPGALGWYRALPLSVGRKVGPIRVPTTHVWSDGDRALDRSGADATGSYVHAAYQLRVLHGVSHWIPLHAPDAMAEIILHRIAGSQT